MSSQEHDDFGVLTRQSSTASMVRSSTNGVESKQYLAARCRFRGKVVKTICFTILTIIHDEESICSHVYTVINNSDDLL